MKDKTILNLQSELDAVQQEFEHTVEELAQKTEDLDNLQIDQNEMEEKCQKLEVVGDESSKKVIGYTFFFINNQTEIDKKLNNLLNDQPFWEEFLEYILSFPYCNAQANDTRICPCKENWLFICWLFFLVNEKLVYLGRYTWAQVIFRR